MEFGFTQFELGKGLKETEQINHGDLDREVDKESKSFNKDEVLAWFDNRNEYEKFHFENQNLNNLDKFNIEIE
ncbi:MAG: hypothetical protein U5M51_14600 [Emticicia sp.]|nr:hypothetical protein [Emticicia sp.]